MPILEQNITGKGRVDEEVRQLEFNDNDDSSKEYKIEAIWDSIVNARDSKSGHLLGLDDLISWKRYLKEENI